MFKLYLLSKDNAEMYRAYVTMIELTLTFTNVKMC